MTGPAYATVEQVAHALDVKSSGHDIARLSRLTHASSRLIDERMHRHFYPLTAAYDYRLGGGGEGFWLDRDLLSLTSVSADGSSVALADVTLSPGEAPYAWVGVYGVDVTLTGVWGFSQDTEPAGALDGAVTDTTSTVITVTDSALVGIGDLLIVGTERLHVTARAQSDTTANVTGNLTADTADDAVTVDDGTLVNQHETILVGTEEMLIRAIAGNVLTVDRAVNGTTLAAHTQPVDVYAPRALTVTRGFAGSTAATHLDAAAVTRNVAPGPIVTLCIAETAVALTQETSAYGRTIGSGDNTQEARGEGLEDVRRMADHYRRLRIAAV